MLIHLIGPGGAGKTTTAKALSCALSLQPIDLDKEYLKTRDIDDDIRNEGYEFYAHFNVETYLRLLGAAQNAVIALSSGFMTYPTSIHPDIQAIQHRLLCSQTTFLLLPSFEMDDCVAKTVRRQMAKPYAGSEAKERDKIQRRFPAYASMSVTRVCTSKPVECVVKEIVARVRSLL